MTRLLPEEQKCAIVVPECSVESTGSGDWLVKLFHVILVGVALSGCSSAANLLGGGSSSPTQQARVPVGNELALPPDLSLRAPTQTVDGYQPNGEVAALQDAPSAPRTQASTSVYGNDAPQDIYAKYGISKSRPDGQAKSKTELTAELKAAILADKRRTNPRYGTIMNIGAIFSDG